LKAELTEEFRRLDKTLIKRGYVGEDKVEISLDLAQGLLYLVKEFAHKLDELEGRVGEFEQDMVEVEDRLDVLEGDD
jgi:hypothetical protein